MPKIIVTYRDTTLMNAVPSVFPNTNVLHCYFHVGKNVRAKCINDCRGKPKDAKVDGKDKEVNEMKQSVIFNNVVRA